MDVFKRYPGFGYSIAVFYLAACWGGNYALGLLHFNSASTHIAALEAGASFVVPLITAFLAVGCSLIISAGSRALAKVIAKQRTSRVKAVKKLIKSHLLKNLRNHLPLVILAAVLLACVYAFFAGVLDHTQRHKYWWVLFLQAIPLWCAILMSVLTVFRIYGMLNRYLSSNDSVSLFEVEKLAPAGDVVLVVFFVFSGTLGLYALNSLFVSLPFIDIALISLGVLITLVCLTIPLKIIQTSLIAKKTEVLQALNSQLSANVSQPINVEQKRRLVDDTSRLQYVSDLLLVRKEVGTIKSFPISQSTTLKLVFLLFLPALSWVGAGMVSQLIKLVS